MSDKLSLTELQLIIKDSLYIALPGMYWVIAEIAEMKEIYAGHCYLELIEKDPEEINIKSRVRAVIWSRKYSFLKSYFEITTGESFKEGLKVLIKVTVEYHEVYGLSLVITDIDPAFTIGEMAIRRQQIIRRLENEGVFTMNKELIFPTLPKRVAIISSGTAAGYNDFLKHLNSNSYGYVFITHLFEASMQGADTENSVVNALDKISGFTNLFDTVAIIRGGGSQADLSWFDNYNIAYHITQFPLPVLTGIGHDKDVSVSDLVAHISLKTPTAVADFLINTFAETEAYLVQTCKEISEHSSTIIKEFSERLDTSRMKLIPLSGEKIAEEREKLSRQIIAITNQGKQYLIRKESLPAGLRARLCSSSVYFISDSDRRIKSYITEIKAHNSNLMRQKEGLMEIFSNNLKILDPDNVLKRGYTVTSRNGTILKSVEMLKNGDNIETKFSDGTISSTVNGD